MTKTTPISSLPPIDQTRLQLSAVLPVEKTGGFICISFWIKNRKYDERKPSTPKFTPEYVMRERRANTVEAAVQIVQNLLANKDVTDIYYCMSPLCETKKVPPRPPNVAPDSEEAKKYECFEVPNRQGELAPRVTLSIDVDVQSAAKRSRDAYATTEEALTAIGNFVKDLGLPPLSVGLLSGTGGAHLSWILETPVVGEAYAELAHALNNAVTAHEIKLDRGTTLNANGILRIAGTFNYKLVKLGGDRCPVVLWRCNPTPIANHVIANALAPYRASPNRSLPNESSVSKQNLAVLGPVSKGMKRAFAELTPEEQLGGCGAVPRDITIIGNYCAWTNHSLATIGADNNHNLQRLAAGVARHCIDPLGTLGRLVDGRQSRIDKGETAAELLAQIDDEVAVGKFSGGFTRCKSIMESGAKQCASCPHAMHRDEGGSPLNLPAVKAATLATPSFVSVSAPDNSISIVPLARSSAGGVDIGHFVAFLPKHNYFFVPDGSAWMAEGVKTLAWAPRLDPKNNWQPMPVLDENGNPKVNPDGSPVYEMMRADRWLDEHRPVQGMAWAPGYPTIIANKFLSEGGWVDHFGYHAFNTYRAPVPMLSGDASMAGPWIDHVKLLYPADADHIFTFLAHRTQKPHEKVNHALCLFGEGMGVGKDTILVPFREAIGPWNFKDVKPDDLFERNNGFLKAVAMLINEVHDLGDVSRRAFYEKSKSIIAGPPETVKINEKYIPEYWITNLVGVIMTSNHLELGLWLPDDDRRHYVAYTSMKASDLAPNYFQGLYNWLFEQNGVAHVCAFLASYDISRFDPKAPPVKTKAFYAIAESCRHTEDGELGDVLETLGNPDAVTVGQIEVAARNLSPISKLAEQCRSSPNNLMPAILRRASYSKIDNAGDIKGRWSATIGGKQKRFAIFAKTKISEAGRYQAAAELVEKLKSTV